jgi:hypothetical protein
MIFDDNIIENAQYEINQSHSPEIYEGFCGGVEWAENQLKDLAIEFAKYVLYDYREIKGYTGSIEELFEIFLKERKSI